MAQVTTKQATEKQGPPAVTLQVNPDTAPARATAFIKNEVAKFARSNTRIYLALILDVIHAHAAQQPKGYAAMLSSLAPHLTMLPKYCTVINPALRSKYAEELASFPANQDGLNNAVKWFENQATKAGYSMSLEDMVRYFKGEWSTKAQAQAKADAMKHAQAESVKQAAEATAQREAQGAADATAKASREEASNKRSKDTQAMLEKELPAPLQLVSSIQPLEQGPALNTDGWSSAMVVIHTKGTETKVTGLESLDDEAVLALFDAVSARIQAGVDAAANQLKAA